MYMLYKWYDYLNIYLWLYKYIPIYPHGLAIALGYKATPAQLTVLFICAFVIFGEHTDACV